MELHFPLILDGATGTELAKRGFTGDVCPEQWVLEHPEAILELQRGYIAAGSNVIYTPTFGGNRVKLGDHGLAEKTVEMNRALAALSREAAGDKALVAGDLAPTGKFLYPMGDVHFEELVDIYREQAAALNDSVDLFVIETMMTLGEARAALLAVREVSDKPVFVSVTCDENGRTLSGTDVCAALLVMQGMGATVFGLNCSTGPEEMTKQIARLADYAEIPLLAKPNAGTPVEENGKTVYHSDPAIFADAAGKLAELGVLAFGGCCGTDASYIRALSDAVKDVECKSPETILGDALPCATERLPFLLGDDADWGDVIDCGEDFADDLEDALDGDSDGIAIRLTDEDGIAEFEEAAYAISKPVKFLAEDAALLEKVLRLYQGRAVYEGNLAEDELLPLIHKYGLICR